MHKLSVSSKSSFDIFLLVLEFSKIGMGIGFISKDFVENEINKKELFEIKTVPEIPKRKILVLTKKEYLPSFSASKLIEIIQKG